MNQEYKESGSKEVENKNDEYVIRDPYIDENTLAKSKDLLYNYHILSKEVPKLNEAIQENNEEYIVYYFDRYAKCIFKYHEFIITDEKSQIEFIDYFFPYFEYLAQPNSSIPVLKKVLISILHVVSFSHYYSLKFVHSPVYQQLLQIIQINTDDFITSISINIIITVSKYDGLSDIFQSLFSLKSLTDKFLSNDSKDYSKEAIIEGFGIYLSEASDDQLLHQIFSCISQCLLQPNLSSELIVDFLDVIARSYSENEKIGLDVLPISLVQFASDHIVELSKLSTIESGGVFNFIHILTLKGVKFNYPVEDLYKIILDENITDPRIKDNILIMFENSIKNHDKVEYSTQFVTQSILSVIQYCFEKGTVCMKNSSQLLIAAILVTDNIQLFLEFIKSTAYPNFIEYVASLESEHQLFISIGILGNAIHVLQVTMPDSNEFHYFISVIFESNLLDHLNSIEVADHSHNDVYNYFTSMIVSEGKRLSPE